MADHLDHLPLPPPEPEPHVVVTGPRPAPRIPSRHPATHATVVRGQIENLENEFDRIEHEPRPEESRGFLYAANFAEESDPNVDGLGDKRTETSVVSYSPDTKRALVFTPRPKLTTLRSKVRAYADPEKANKDGGPRNARLVASLESLRVPTLVDLSEGWLGDDTVEDGTWVEIWMRGGILGDPQARERRRDALVEFLTSHGLMVGGAANGDPRAFIATEHDLYLLRLSAAALRDLPSQLPEVFHIGPPQKAVVPQMLELQKGELEVPEVQLPNGETPTVAILDTGISETHPLIAPLLLAPGVSAVVGDSSSADSNGHGTKMAGLAAYRDLGHELGAGKAVQARCQIQNVRILGKGEGPAPEPMLERTQDGVLEAEQVPASRRIFSLSIGSQTRVPEGSTPWSVAIDQLAFDGRLFCVAAGNSPIEGLPKPGDYPYANLSSGLTSPGEALNALTVGAITDKTTIDPPSQGRTPVASAGQLNPSSRCDVGLRRPIKPDVVVEGGNLSTDASGCRMDKAMQLLTTCKEHAVGPWLTTASMTSAATAKAAGLAAEIWAANPTRRPETIRGLIVHSARWTPAMTAQFTDPRDRFRAVGYGAPSFDSASWSEYARPTVIYEGAIHPLRMLDLQGSGGKRGREMHFHKLPLPHEALEALGDSTVELSVTLSYFTQPNETRGVRYASAGLRWEMQRPLETEAKFRKRINRLEREDGEKFQADSEGLGWDMGIQARGRGTVQSDRATPDASQLLGPRAIAVWPVGGWWSDRGIEEDLALRYSLIITLDAGEEDVDLYTPILNEISVLTGV
jgi:hypothetical protein